MMNNPLILSTYPIFVLIKKMRVDHYLMRYTPDELRRELVDVLSKILEKNTLAHYAMVALLDDVIITSQWEFADQWLAQSLQTIYYSEQIAGQGLLDRLEKSLNDNDVSPEIAEFLYYGYLWRTESQETDPLLRQLKDRLGSPTIMVTPALPAAPTYPLPSVKKMMFGSIGILLIVYVWLQALFTWELSHVKSALIQEVAKIEN